ncbi:DUF998 domain-containing protein [Streptomyces sp. HGB0020]|uniref:DUF998 domain-containing protein n=1 Tax=Streptomyces sp. HGB0020 TaxID=1078086 RepID=UPI00034E57E3|nr:DUF998 domain-containing protein [Streptomyces sp. HGB0020]EPD57762.1 hypothetical protein HMPREF1211_06100 [Streptomyces sp. HGB0020]
MTLAALFAALGVLGIVGYLAVFIALHVLPTGYHAVHHAVSDYAIGAYGTLFRRGLYLSSIGLLLLTIGLCLNPGAPPLQVSDLVFLFLVPFMRVGMALFPTNLEGEKVSLRGLAHYAFAVAAFAFTYSAISGLTSTLSNLPPWNAVSGLLSALHEIALISLILVVITLIPRLRKVFGLFERVFLVSTNVWFVVGGVCLINAKL